MLFCEQRMVAGVYGRSTSRGPLLLEDHPFGGGSGMTVTSTDLILHHYDFSNYSEKARLALGYKELAWRAVIIPAVAPKPRLTPLTGGYRRTPVLQVGADIYCDTRLILAELERRKPEPTLFPRSSRAI